MTTRLPTAEDVHVSALVPLCLFAGGPVRLWAEATKRTGLVLLDPKVSSGPEVYEHMFDGTRSARAGHGQPPSLVGGSVVARSTPASDECAASGTSVTNRHGLDAHAAQDALEMPLVRVLGQREVTMSNCG